MSPETQSQVLLPYHSNILTPISITVQALAAVISDLQDAISQGVHDLLSNVPELANDVQTAGTLFNGALGVPYALHRLSYQLPSSSVPPSAIHTRIPRKPAALHLEPGRPSPLSSPVLGAALLRLLTSQPSPSDLPALQEAVSFALRQPRTVWLRGHDMGVDEVLCGRAGLLWALLELQRRQPDGLEGELGDMVRDLVKAVLSAGREGAEDFKREHPDSEKWPFAWPWLNGFLGFGAMHGMTGILCILLDPTLHELCPAIEDEYASIAATIELLWRITARKEGHLPMSSPEWPRERASPLVQICHGTPGLLQLLTVAGLNTVFVKTYQQWHASWLNAINTCSKTVWEQGLLTKGGRICHGIDGNAWTILSASAMLEYGGLVINERDLANYTPEGKDVLSQDGQLTGDGLLGMALAILLECRNTRPFDKSAAGSVRHYGVPDNPYSLFEGLAGTVCAWSEACVVIEARLHKLSTTGAQPVAVDEKLRSILRRITGFPSLGGGFVI